MTLSIQLRDATREIHEKIEALPFHQALREKKLGVVSVRTLLRALAIVHSALEKELDSCADERVRSVTRVVSVKSGWLRRNR